MDRAEVEDWYRRYGFAVHRRCRRLLGNDAAAADAVQEVFVRVLRYGGGFSGEQPLRWLYRIADHHCFDRLRAQKRNGSTERHAGLLEAQGDGVDPERERLLLDVIARCRPKIRDTALHYYFDGMTQEEIASAMGCTRDAIKRRLDKFKSEARRLLGEK